MDIRFKIYHRNGASYFVPCLKGNIMEAISDALRIAVDYQYDKIDIYNDSKLIATIYG